MASIIPKLAFYCMFSPQIQRLPFIPVALANPCPALPKPLRKHSSLAGRCPALLASPPSSLSLPAVAFEGPRSGPASRGVRPAASSVGSLLSSNSDFNQLLIMRRRLSPRRPRPLGVRAHVQSGSNVSLL